ncbi:MAG: hypothetical protein LUD03_02090, partial [Firmicutes bacterium]|nr:hypothetical protein [Bacillota bacterium]
TEEGTTQYTSDDVPVWSAADSKDSLTNYLHEGDVIGVSGGVIIKMVDVEKLANLASGMDSDNNQFTGEDSISSTRDNVKVGYVGDISNNEYTNFEIYSADGSSSSTWFLESSVVITRINVTTDGNGFVSADVDDSDTMDPSEIAEFDPDEITGDYIFSRNFKNGAQREVFIYTFND